MEEPLSMIEPSVPIQSSQRSACEYRQFHGQAVRSVIFHNADGTIEYVIHL